MTPMRWTYIATDIQSVNRYFPGVHAGEAASWSLRPGHVYSSRSFLTSPLDWPLHLKQPVNQPFIITESSSASPSPSTTPPSPKPPP